MTDSSSTSSPSPKRVEIGVLLALLVLAIALRTFALDRVAVEHFDEGVYASNLWFPDANFEYPGRHLYAPPVMPALIEWAHLFCGEAQWVAMLPGLLLGSGTVIALWWTARRMFGSAAAVAAAAIVATNEFHISLSRSALTDAALFFFLTLSVGCAHRAILTRQFRFVLGAGLLAGLAWSTKYNGWLALAIGASGSAAAWLGQKRRTFQALLPSDEESLPSGGMLVRVIALITVIAVVAWLPVWWDLQPHGGYSAVAANHRQYVTGFAHWWSNWIRQVEFQMHYAGWLTWLGAWLAVVVAGLVLRAERSTWNNEANQATSTQEASGLDAANSNDRFTWNDSATLTGIVMTGSMLSATLLNPLLVFVIWPLIDWVTSYLEFNRPGGQRRSAAEWIGLWLCLAWLLGLLLATPLYRPYPRLVLPLMGCGWIGMGSAIVRLLRGRLVGLRSPATSGALKKVFVAMVVMMLVVSTTHAARRGFRAWPDRTELADAAHEAIAAIRTDSAKTPDINGVRAAVYVCGEPGLFYHLPQPDLAVQPVQDLAFARPGAPRLPLPTYLITGPHAELTPQFVEEMRALRDSFDIVTVLPFRASNFVVFDDYSPRDADDHRAGMIRVLRLKAQRN